MGWQEVAQGCRVGLAQGEDLHPGLLPQGWMGGGDTLCLPLWGGGMMAHNALASGLILHPCRLWASLHCARWALGRGHSAWAEHPLQVCCWPCISGRAGAALMGQKGRPAGSCGPGALHVPALPSPRHLGHEREGCCSFPCPQLSPPCPLSSQYFSAPHSIAPLHISIGLFAPYTPACVGRSWAALQSLLSLQGRYLPGHRCGGVTPKTPLCSPRSMGHTGTTQSCWTLEPA